jgi:hypothetical protein
MTARKAHDSSFITFRPTENPPGIEVVDEIERRRQVLYMSRTPAPEPADTKQFQFPVTEAASVRTKELYSNQVIGVYVRDSSQSMVANVIDNDSVSLGDETWTLELDGHVKTYLRVDGPVDIRSGTEQTRIKFEEPTAVTVGARSRHEQPAATITTTADPHDVSRAIESFSSALKTTSPERSYPSLRGHPPRVEFGDTLDIPDDLKPPETDVRLELPMDFSKLFVAAPLAFYFGAEIVPSENPRLTTATGFSYQFDESGFESDVVKVLKHVFLCDCVTRTAGLYNLDLHERKRIESLVPWDFDKLYEQPLAEQLETYLRVPYERIEPVVPKWQLATHVEPTARSVPMLPFLLNNLSIIYTASKGVGDAPPSSESSKKVFTRSDKVTRHLDGDSSTNRNYVSPNRSRGLEQAWVGEQVPIGASKLTREAVENRLERRLKRDDIAITVVLNDMAMETEQKDALDTYGGRDDFEVDVTTRENLTVSELRSVLTEECDFLHFIGHTDRGGLHCADGKLDIDTVEQTGVETFLFNACDSYTQGLALVEAGAIGGIVTLSDIVNDAAVRIGQQIGKLLNLGFPLQQALEIVRSNETLGRPYIIVGDGGVNVVQSQSAVPNLLDITRAEDDFLLTYRSFPTAELGMGALTSPNLDQGSDYYLTSGELDTFNLTKAELNEFLELENSPVRVDGDLYWSDELDLDEVFDE